MADRVDFRRGDVRDLPFVEGKSPDLHFLCGLGWFREAGLEKTMARTFAGCVHAPFDEEIRRVLDALIRMRWRGSISEISPDDRETYERLVDPDSASFILERSDYCAIFTYTMFSGIA